MGWIGVRSFVWQMTCRGWKIECGKMLRERKTRVALWNSGRLRCLRGGKSEGPGNDLMTSALLRHGKQQPHNFFSVSLALS